MTVVTATREREEAARLPEGDVIRTLLEQHARIRELFADVMTARDTHRRQAFDELRALLAVHETAEEMVLRPVSRKIASEVADARNKEEADATRVLRELEKTDVFSADFEQRLRGLEQDVSDHADLEEREEFPAVRAACDLGQLRQLGDRLHTAERFAPTHPHPGTAGSPAMQWAVGPFASICDKVKDAIRAVGQIGDNEPRTR